MTAAVPQLYLDRDMRLLKKRVTVKFIVFFKVKHTVF